MKKICFALLLFILLPLAACAPEPSLPEETRDFSAGAIPVIYTYEEKITPSPLPEFTGDAAGRTIMEFDIQLPDQELKYARQVLYEGGASSDEIYSFLEIDGIRYDFGRIGARTDEKIAVNQFKLAYYDSDIYAQYRSAETDFTRYYYVKSGSAPQELFCIDGRVEYVNIFLSIYVNNIWSERTRRLYKYDSSEAVLYSADIAALFGCDRVEKDGRFYSALDRNGTVMARYTLEREGFYPGVPDRLGSWGNISSPLTFSDDWEQIVTDSPFHLGTTYIRGYWGPEDEKTPYYGFRFGTYPNIDGSTVAMPMAFEFARQHLGLSEADATTFVSFQTTHAAYSGLIIKEDSHNSGSLHEFYDVVALSDDTHPTDLVIATYPSEDELSFARQRGIDLKIEPVCYDAFVFITHKDNPVDSLTLDEVRRIYSGGITNWKEVGGNDAPIAAYQREADSGSQTGMEQLVMQGVPMSPPQTTIVDSMGGLIDAVAEYQNGLSSIGYTYKYYIDKLYRNDNIKILRIDGIPPDSENIASLKYPLTVSYYGVVRENDGEDSTGRQFLDWMLSDEGQRCIAQAGYLPLSQ
ncbi:MAG: substrate-binding domain-containing protein [Syntrophomonadaceae bacterium]|jgi:phosphate transport system substrate-binding protein|nr:substrate-binding domain-containing protein [Syntrophomonadaceae bacterium]